MGILLCVAVAMFLANWLISGYAQDRYNRLAREINTLKRFHTAQLEVIALMGQAIGTRELFRVELAFGEAPFARHQRFVGIAADPAEITAALLLVNLADPREFVTGFLQVLAETDPVAAPTYQLFINQLGQGCVETPPTELLQGQLRVEGDWEEIKGCVERLYPPPALREPLPPKVVEP